MRIAYKRQPVIITLNRYTKQRDQITTNLNMLNNSDSEYMNLIENAFQHLENFKQTYLKDPCCGKYSSWQ